MIYFLKGLINSDRKVKETNKIGACYPQSQVKLLFEIKVTSNIVKDHENKMSLKKCSLSLKVKKKKLVICKPLIYDLPLWLDKAVLAQS